MRVNIGNRCPGMLLICLVTASFAIAQQSTAPNPPTPSEKPTQEGVQPSLVQGPPLPMGIPIESVPIETRKNRAASFVAQGRAALDRGQYQLAQQYAAAAEKEKVPESAWLPGEPRPWMLTLDVDKAIRSGKGPIQQAAGQRTAEAIPSGIQQGAFISDQDRTRNVPVSGTSPGLSNAATSPSLQAISGNGNGEALYRQGLEALQAGRRDEAMRLFSEAWKDEKNLPVDVRRQLKDKLSMLRPTPLGSGASQKELVSPQAREAQLIRQKIYNDVTRELAATTEIRTSDPMIALDRIKRLRGNVLEADLDPVGKQQLLSIVDRALQAQETYVQEHKSIIEQSLRNDQIREGISQTMQLRRETDVKISDLVEQFNELMEQRRYSEAEVLAKQVQELDPGSPIASLMKQKSLVSVRQQENDRIASLKEESFYQAMQNTEISSQAFNDNKPFQFGEPRTWEQISELRRRRQLEQNETRLGPREQEIYKKLANTVDVRFRAAPLETVLENLSRMTEIPIVIDDRALSEVRITRDQPINLELNTPISLRSALQLILGPLDLNYVIRNEVMEITNRDAQRSHTYPVTYPVGDLVIPIPNFGLDYDTGMAGALRSAYAMMGRGLNVQTQPVSFLGMANKDAGPVPPNPNVLAQSGMGGFPIQGGMGPGVGPFGVPGMAGGGGGAADFSQLIALIEGTIQPDTWASAGGQSRITEYPGNLTLVISTTSEVHDQIRDLLAALRRLQNLQVTIEVRFITLSDNFFERMGFDFDFRIDDNVNRIPAEDEGRSVLIGTTQNGLPTADFDIRIDQNHLGATLPPFGGFDAGAATGIGFAILSDIEAFFFMQALQGDNRTNVLQAPKVTLFDGQFASVFDVSQRPFVVSVVPVVGDFAVAQQPVIVILNEGTQLNVQAVVSNDKRFVRLTLVPMFSRIDEVNTFTFEGTSRTVSNSKKRKDNNNDKTDDEKEDAEQVIETRGTTVQQPTFAFTSVSTTVSVPDGGTILLGGIKRLREGRNERGLPILSKIPYVKRLFSNVAIGRDASSLMMMVTPRIIIQEEEELAQTGYDPLR